MTQPIRIPAAQFDSLANSLDTPDPAPKLAEIADRPRRYRQGLNVRLAYRVLDHLVSHPDQFTADVEITWIDDKGYQVEPGKGLMIGDFSGWTCVLAGQEVTDEVDDIIDRAMDLLGLDGDADDWLLGWPDVETVMQLQTVVPEIFGPRPEAAS